MRAILPLLAAVALSLAEAQLRDIEQSKVDAYNVWLVKNGVRVKNLEIHDFGGQHGLGLKVTGEIAEGEICIDVPADAVLQQHTMSDCDPKLKRGFKALKRFPQHSFIYGLSAMLAGSTTNCTEKWGPFLDVQPREDEIELLMDWSPDEVDELKGTVVHGKTLRMKDAWQGEFEEISKKLKERDVTPHFEFTEDVWQWAAKLAFSRSVWAKPPKIREMKPALVPMHDMLNSDETSNNTNRPSTKWQAGVNSPRLKSGKKLHDRMRYQLYADATYDPGEQMFVHYQKGITNFDKLVNYGFTIENNVAEETVQFKAELALTDPLYEAKAEKLQDYGYGLNPTFHLGGPKGIPMTIAEYYRLALISDKATLEDFAFDQKQVSEENEVGMYRIIIMKMNQYIQTANETWNMKRDQELAKDENIPRALRQAINIRQGEIKLWLSLRWTLMEMLDDVNDDIWKRKYDEEIELAKTGQRKQNLPKRMKRMTGKKRDLGEPDSKEKTKDLAGMLREEL